MNIATKKPDIDSPITLSLLKFFQEQEIPHRDVFQEFLKANQPYFTFDGHPSEEGYKIFTEVLIDQIVPTLQK
jgi:lysophospholipase L1-like esterase